MHRFLPTCDGGAVFNKEFKGFIDYKTIRRVDERQITDAHLKDVLVSLMDRFGRRQQYPVCMFGDGTKIPDETFKKCSQTMRCKMVVKGQEREAMLNLRCYRYVKYEDRWYIDKEKINNIRQFLVDEDWHGNEWYNITLDMLSVEKLKDYIKALPEKFEPLGNGEFLVYSYNMHDVETKTDLYFLQEFTETLRMQIIPQKGALVGLQFDVFGYWKELGKELVDNCYYGQSGEQLITKLFDYKNLHQEKEKQYKEKEAEEVEKRCIAALRNELQAEPYEGGYFEVPFDKEVLYKVVNRFYFKKSFAENDGINLHEYLAKNNTSRFKQYCAPQLSETTNPAIDLPYFWCRGIECFHNNLGNQALEEETIGETTLCTIWWKLWASLSCIRQRRGMSRMKLFGNS